MGVAPLATHCICHVRNLVATGESRSQGTSQTAHGQRMRDDSCTYRGCVNHTDWLLDGV